MKDWRCSQAAGQVCEWCFTVDNDACCMCCDGGKDSRGACVGLKEARVAPPLLIADAVVQVLAPL